MRWWTEQLAECQCGKLADCGHHGRLQMLFCALSGVQTDSAVLHEFLHNEKEEVEKVDVVCVVVQCIGIGFVVECVCRCDVV